jgi:hypothetical protein
MNQPALRYACIISFHCLLLLQYVEKESIHMKIMEEVPTLTAICYKPAQNSFRLVFQRKKIALLLEAKIEEILYVSPIKKILLRKGKK